MAERSVTEIIKEAAAAAQNVPEHLQEIAFSKAFDALAGTAGPERSAPSDQGHSTRKRGISAKTSRTPVPATDDRQQILGSINRTDYPEINHDRPGLDNALRLLQAARDDYELDGLGAAEIATLLTEKFRARITRQAIGQSLNGANKYVDRYKDGASVLFRLMGPGEAFLDAGGSTSSDAGSASRPARKRQASAKSKKAPASAKTHKDSTKTTSKSSRSSPSSDVNKLYESGYFNQPRVIGAVVSEIRDRFGRSYKSRELSVVLLRYLRTDKLTRYRNGDNQYEYSKP